MVCLPQEPRLTAIGPANPVDPVESNSLIPFLYLYPQISQTTRITHIFHNNLRFKDDKEMSVYSSGLLNEIRKGG